MRRKDRQRDEGFALELLQNCSYAVISTVGPDGAPYGVPVNPVLKGKTLYFHCAHTGKKTDHIKAHPLVCVTCVNLAQTDAKRFTTAYASAIAFGRASQVTDGFEKTEALHLLCDKYGMPDGPAREKELQSGLSHTAVYKILIEQITGKENPL